MTVAPVAPIVIGIVGEASPRATLLAAIEAADALPEILTEATALTRGATVDAIIFDLGAQPDRCEIIALALAADPRTRGLPRVLLVDASMPVERIAAFGVAAVVPSKGASDAKAAAITDVVAEVRARHVIARRARADHAELRAAEQRLRHVHEGGATLSHDARVLFGVILGFASNLRDGIVGPVSAVQAAQLSNIVQASTDAAALLERYMATLRAALPAADPNESPSARVLPPQRRQHDLAELARATVSLFQGIANARDIRLVAVAPRAVLSWCDAMQIKQALVNLLANALKLTPAGGLIEVAVQVGAPASTRGGATARREVELVVSDCGPGIPVDERERVFERGVRLERDRSSPGSGIGLAVVRDVVELHGGAVRIDETPGGGASVVMILPVDLRTRSSDQLAALTGGGTR